MYLIISQGIKSHYSIYYTHIHTAWYIYTRMLKGYDSYDIWNAIHSDLSLLIFYCFTNTISIVFYQDLEFSLDRITIILYVIQYLAKYSAGV